VTPMSEPVENYLDELLARLHGAPSAVRRMMAETELHLYTAVEEGLSQGLDVPAAGFQAVRRFGSAEQVARAWNAQAPAEPMRSFVHRLAGELALLAGVGLTAIGISGLLARLMTAMWGLRFMFADPPGTRYTVGQCHYWLRLHPHAAGCTGAYLAESLTDGTDARFAAGVIGVAVLTIVGIQRRRRGIRLLTPPSTLTAFAAAALFTAASTALLALGADDLRIAGGNGAGQWLSGAVVSFPLAVLFIWLFLRQGRRTPSTADPNRAATR
jgi:hypothetical protein